MKSQDFEQKVTKVTKGEGIHFLSDLRELRDLLFNSLPHFRVWRSLAFSGSALPLCSFLGVMGKYLLSGRWNP